MCLMYLMLQLCQLLQCVGCVCNDWVITSPAPYKSKGATFLPMGRPLVSRICWAGCCNRQVFRISSADLFCWMPPPIRACTSGQGKKTRSPLPCSDPILSRLVYYFRFYQIFRHLQRT